MKKEKVVGAFVAVLFILSTFSGLAIARDKPVSVIIGFEDSSDEVRVLIETHGGTVKGVWNIIPAMAATLPPKAIEAIQRSPNVVYVETDGTVYALKGKPPSPPGKDKPKKEQPPQELPWGIDQIDAELAWSNSTGKGVEVAVLDTGIDYNHPDLDDNVKGGVSVVGLRESTKPRDWKDKNGHGTHCAGIIAAEDNEIGAVGVAPNASLYAVKVLRNDGRGTYSDMIDGIQWCMNNNNNIQVISMSFGGTSDSQAMKAACDAANASGLVLVAAAGNSGDGDPTTDEISYPAAYDSVIAVGATNKSAGAPYWSNSGPHLELAAPGVDIKSTWLDEGYNIISGTSMSCPHVSGTAALIWADNSNLPNGDVRSVLQTTADDLGDAGKDNVYGYGLVDAEESVLVV